MLNRIFKIPSGRGAASKLQKIGMSTKSGDIDYRICEFLWHGPCEGEISQSWATEIIRNEGEADIEIGGQYQMEWSGGRKKGKNVYPITLLKIFHSLEEAKGNFSISFHIPMP